MGEALRVLVMCLRTQRKTVAGTAALEPQGLRIAGESNLTQLARIPTSDAMDTIGRLDEHAKSIFEL